MSKDGGGGDGGGDGMGARCRGWAGEGGCAVRQRSRGPRGRRAQCAVPTERCPEWRRRTAGRSCSRKKEGNFSGSSGTIHLQREKWAMLLFKEIKVVGVIA